MSPKPIMTDINKPGVVSVLIRSEKTHYICLSKKNTLHKQMTQFTVKVAKVS